MNSSTPKGIASISVLKKPQLEDLNEYYIYVGWLVVVLSPLMSMLATLAVDFHVTWPISPDHSWYKVRLDLYDHPNHKYWLNLQTAVLMPVLSLYMYRKSFKVKELKFPHSAKWGAITGIFLAALCIVGHVYFGLDGKEGNLSRGTTSTLLGIHMMNHLVLLGGIISLVIPSVYLTWRLGIYHGRSKQ